MSTATQDPRLWHRWEDDTSAWLPGAVRQARSVGVGGQLIVVASDRVRMQALQQQLQEDDLVTSLRVSVVAAAERDDFRAGDVVIGRRWCDAPGVRMVDVPPTSDALVQLAGRIGASRDPQRTPLSDAYVMQFMGGLGNQMFQYAVARSLADRHGGRLVGDVRWFDAHPHLRWELESWNVRLDDVIRADADVRRFDTTALAGCSEAQFPVNQQVAHLRPGTVMTGYFQSPAYFEANTERLRADFTLARPAGAWFDAVSERMRGRVASVHARRGDYVSNASANAFHGTCSVDYYRRAIDLVRRTSDLDGVAVFSDDVAWAAEHLLPVLGDSAFVVEAPASAGSAESMALLGLADTAVIANSTFSWWGAWLRRSAGLVVAPRPWFNDPTDTRDLLPKNWVTVDGR